MSPRGEGPPSARPDDATTHPLWSVALVLGEIAERVARRDAEEHERPGERCLGADDDVD